MPKMYRGNATAMVMVAEKRGEPKKKRRVVQGRLYPADHILVKKRPGFFTELDDQLEPVTQEPKPKTAAKSKKGGS